MADIFFHLDVKDLLNKKHIMFFGDSNVRAVYKDLLCLLNSNSLIKQADLKRKQEDSFCGDKLGKHSVMNRGREYEEERSFEKNGTKVEYYFITRCYNPMFVDMMEDIHLGLREAPDVIYINSSLWDVSRWGPDGVTQFKDNLQKLARLFKSSLPESTMVIWATAMPVSPLVKSGLLIKQIDFLQHMLRFDIMEANQFARQVMVTHGFDVLDLHFHLRMQSHRRVHDGVHYLPVAVRLVTNLLLTHMALNWEFPLPNRVETILLNKAIASVSQCTNNKRSKNTSKHKFRIPNGDMNKLEKPMKRFSGRGKGYRNRPYQRNGIHEPHHRNGRVKGVGRGNIWNSQPADQRGWPGPTNLQGPAQNNFSQPWHFRSNIWSDDHWPNAQQCLSEDRFNNELRFLDEPRFLDNIHQAMRLRQSSLPFQSRFTPY